MSAPPPAAAIEPASPIRLALPDEAATAALGARLGRALCGGDALLLSGPLGAGKSALARALVRAALGAPALEVPSPSYTLVNVYAGGGLEIWHADLYRLSGPEEVAELALDEAAPGILIVEWPDRLGSLRPPRRLEITLSPVPLPVGRSAPDTAPGAVPETGRIAELSPVGPGWARALAAAAP